MKRQPVVSILINCYNGEKYLKDAIDSVFAQTYQAWEIIFWDNQSTDRSAEIFKAYNDQRLKYFYAPKHTWLYEARNCAIDKAQGEFIAFLDVDDWWLPDKLERQIPLFLDSEVGFVCSNYWLKNEKRNLQWKALKGVIANGWVLNDLLENYFVGLLTLVVRRAALQKLEYPCNPKYHVIGDLDLVVRLSVDWKMDCIQEPLAICRKHENNELIKHRSRHLAEFESWIESMNEVDSISTARNFHYLKVNYSYQKAIHQIFTGDRIGAFNSSRGVPWGILKFRLWAALILPIFALRKVKSD